MERSVVDSLSLASGRATRVTLAVSALLCLLALGCAESPAPASPETSAPERVEAVVYTSIRPGNFDLFLFDRPDGEPRRLTTHVAMDYNATFSPDGLWVVFTSERSGSPDLWALSLEPDATPVRLTSHRALDDAADFSPDGRQLVFVSTRDGDADIFVMPFAPGDPGAEEGARNLTRRPGGDFQPAFSPDGSRIAYSRQVERWNPIDFSNPRIASAEAALYVMDSDGSNPRRLSKAGPGYVMEGVEFGRVTGSPAWSRDGESLVYYQVAAEGPEVRRVALDGSGDEVIAQGGLSPAVSMDGRIVFSRIQPREDMDAMDRLKTGRLVSVAQDGGDLREESDGSRSYFAPDVDRVSNGVLCHGTAPADPLAHPSTAAFARFGEGYVFAPPGARARVDLPDRSLEVIGVRGFFPALLPTGEVVSTPMHRAGPSLPLEATALDRWSPRDVFTPESGFAWGAVVARSVGRMYFAVGPLFAPGEARVDVWAVDLDGSRPKNLTADIVANDALPHSTPDGRLVAFRSGGDSGGSVFVMDGEGGGRRRLTDSSAIETMPTLSPDGERVVFSTFVEGSYKLWIQRLDGSEGRMLEPDRVDIPDHSLHPRFSPDGKWLVFTSDRSGFNDEWPLTWVPQPYGELWALPVEGGSAVRLTHNKWEDGPSDWGLVPADRLPHRD